MLQRQDYYPAPFWFLNHKLEKEELLRQLKLMKEQNITAFFMHPRAGLLTPYGSREWFELIRYTALEAKKLGMNPWLYDEDPFPSGPAGGRVLLEHPEFRARGLHFFDLTPENGRLCADLGEAMLLEAFAVRCDKEGNVLEKRDVYADAGMIRSDFFQTLWPSPYYHHLFGKETFNHYRSVTSFPHLQIDIPLEDGWKVYAVTVKTQLASSNRGLPDNLNPACVREFIRLTHEKYDEYLGDLFGSVIPGIFTDETATGDDFAWTPRFGEEFRKRRGFAIEGRYHEIFRGTTESAQTLREAYWKTVYDLFVDAFFKTVNDWCKAHHLLLCGHGIGEEIPLATTNGMNIFDLQKYVGIPGFDHITPNIPNWTNFTSLNLGGKLVSSAAEQNGVSRVMSECFGCNAYNFFHDGMKRNMRWLNALGVNFLVPHGFHYSYDGFRKDDAGKSFFFQSPDYGKFHEFGRYAANLGYLLGESRSTARVCLVFPENAFRRMIPAQREKALECLEALYASVQKLLQNQVQFELADEVSLQAAEISDTGFRCGKKTYDRLVLPFPLEREWLAKFKKFTVTPEACYGIDGFAVLDGDSGETARTVMTQYRSTPQGKRLYFFHNDDKPARFRLRFDRAPGAVCRYDEELEKFYQFSPDEVFSLPSYGAALFELPDAPIEAPPYPQQQIPEPDLTFLQHPQWDYVPPVDGIAASLRDWNVSAGSEHRNGVRYAILRELFGKEWPMAKTLYPTPIFDRAPFRPRFYPVRAVYETEFEIPAKGNSRWQLLFEGDTLQGKAVLHLNGQELSAPERCRVYDPWNMETDLTAAIREGKNTLTITFPEAGDFDGLTSMIYVRALSTSAERQGK